MSEKVTVSTVSSRSTPSRDAVHAVPAEAVMLLQALLTRTKMAGKEFGGASRSARRIGLATTLLTSVTSLGVFATLQSEPGLPARLVVGAALALAAILSAWQTWVGKSIQEESPALNELLGTFDPLKDELVRSLSDCQLYGTPVERELLDRVNRTLDAHMKARPGEFPAFERARREAMEELVDLGFLRD